LTILNTISELVGTAIQRTGLQQATGSQPIESGKVLSDALKRVFVPKIEALIACLNAPNNKNDTTNDALEMAINLQQQNQLITPIFRRRFSNSLLKPPTKISQVLKAQSIRNFFKRERSVF